MSQAPVEKTKEAVLTAVRSGYRFIDTANDYDNEHIVGEALTQLFSEGTVKRQELVVLYLRSVLAMHFLKRSVVHWHCFNSIRTFFGNRFFFLPPKKAILSPPGYQRLRRRPKCLSK